MILGKGFEIEELLMLSTEVLRLMWRLMGPTLALTSSGEAAMSMPHVIVMLDLVFTTPNELKLVLTCVSISRLVH